MDTLSPVCVLSTCICLSGFVCPPDTKLQPQHITIPQAYCCTNSLFPCMSRLFGPRLFGPRQTAAPIAVPQTAIPGLLLHHTAHTAHTAQESEAVRMDIMCRQWGGWIQMGPDICWGIPWATCTCWFSAMIAKEWLASNWKL